VYTTAGFEGPLGLLLHLIQKAEVNIYDIPIAEITEQFIAYLESEESVLLGDLTEFYKMAADLLYIKSRMLLPVELEFDEEYQDPRQELVERLLEHQRFKKYTDLLSGTATSGELFISRKPSQFRLPFGDEELFGEVTLDDLLATFRKLIKQIAPSKVFNVYESVTVNEKIALMQEVFETREYMTIEELIVDPTSRLHIICAFLAILDATKQGMIYLLQERAFETIVIEDETSTLKRITRMRMTRTRSSSRRKSNPCRSAMRRRPISTRRTCFLAMMTNGNIYLTEMWKKSCLMTRRMSRE